MKITASDTGKEYWIIRDYKTKETMGLYVSADTKVGILIRQRFTENGEIEKYTEHKKFILENIKTGERYISI